MRDLSSTSLINVSFFTWQRHTELNHGQQELVVSVHLHYACADMRRRAERSEEE